MIRSNVGNTVTNAAQTTMVAATYGSKMIERRKKEDLSTTLNAYTGKPNPFDASMYNNANRINSENLPAQQVRFATEVEPEQKEQRQQISEGVSNLPAQYPFNMETFYGTPDGGVIKGSQAFTAFMSRLAQSTDQGGELSRYIGNNVAYAESRRLNSGGEEK